MTRSDRPRHFLDALSGQDGTQALSTVYQVAPVYPDASLGVLPETRPPVQVPVTLPRLPGPPVVDPQLLAELAQPLRPLAGPPRQGARPPGAPAAQPQPARRTTALAAGGVVAAPYSQQVAPSRQQAASAGHYQGPVPHAVAPAAASNYNTPMTYAGQQWSAFPPGAAPIQATGSPRRPSTPPNATAGPTSNRFTRSASGRKRTGWVQGTIFLVIFLLVTSGLGARLVDLIQQLVQR